MRKFGLALLLLFISHSVAEAASARCIAGRAVYAKAYTDLISEYPGTAATLETCIATCTREPKHDRAACFIAGCGVACLIIGMDNCTEYYGQKLEIDSQRESVEKICTADARKEAAKKARLKAAEKARRAAAERARREAAAAKAKREAEQRENARAEARARRTAAAANQRRVARQATTRTAQRQKEDTPAAQAERRKSWSRMASGLFSGKTTTTEARKHLNKDGTRFEYSGAMREALRGVIKIILKETSLHGLPSDSYLIVIFSTEVPGVQVPKKMFQKPDPTFRIVLKDNFQDLQVEDTYFAVTLPFDGTPKRVVVPYGAILNFIDPPQKFGLKFTEE